MTPDNPLAYMDQASFLGLRSLGRGPLIQFTWVYRREVDLAGLRRFHRNLGAGLLGRRVECSRIPGGRHRWIAWSGPPDVDVCAEAWSAGRIADWADEQAALPIDPEHGPSWRLAMTPLTDGGAAVTLVVSHTVADGVGVVTAIAEAVRGIGRDLDYPAAGSRTTFQAVLADTGQFIGDVPKMARAAAAVARLARRRDQLPSVVAERTSRQPGRAGRSLRAKDPVRIPSATIYVDIGQWDRRAARLGGSSNSMVMAFAARLAVRLGWCPAHGAMTLSVPVNARAVGDNRGNALTGVRVMLDPDTVAEDLTPVRAALKAAIAASAEDRLLAALPLIPLTPKFVARRIERMIVGGRVVGCSNLGDLDPVVNRPDGSDADDMTMRLTENLRRSDLMRSGGAFFPVGSARVNQRVIITAGYADADGSTTRPHLVEALKGSLDDLGIGGEIV